MKIRPKRQRSVLRTYLIGATVALALGIFFYYWWHNPLGPGLQLPEPAFVATTEHDWLTLPEQPAEGLEEETANNSGQASAS